MEGLREERMKTHLGTLARALPSATRAVCPHPGLLPRCESNWICPRRHSRSPHSPDASILGPGASPSLISQSEGRQVPPGGVWAWTKMEGVMQLAGKCFQNGLQVSLQKWKRKKKSIRLQSLFGECVSKGSLHAMETNPRSPVSAY